MNKLIVVPVRQKVPKAGALSVLKQNLTALYKLHPKIKGNRPLLAAKAGISDGSLGQMLRGAGNPTLENIEAVATYFHLEVWELLLPGLDAKAAVGKGMSESEAKMIQKIEENMRALGITEHRLAHDTGKEKK